VNRFKRHGGDLGTLQPKERIIRFIPFPLLVLNFKIISKEFFQPLLLQRSGYFQWIFEALLIYFNDKVLVRKVLTPFVDNIFNYYEFSLID